VFGSTSQIPNLWLAEGISGALVQLLKAHQFDAVEREPFSSLEHDNVSLHCFDASIMGPDLRNGANHANERRGYPR
jgi:hypothetical protein